MSETRRKSKRTPVSPEKFYSIHESYMEYYRKRGMVVADTLKWNFAGGTAVRLEGKIFFDDQKRLCLNVSKTLRIFSGKSGKKLMKTEIYGYNLNYEGKKNSEIFRYDNFDLKPRRGHNNSLHCHRYDPPGREILNSPFVIDPEDFPTLGQVIEEAHKYYIDHVAPKKNSS